MNSETAYFRDKHIQLLGKTLQIFQTVLQDVTQEQATTLRDGEDGWTPLEILAHVHEYDGIFLQRGQAVATGERPTFEAYDVDALARDHAYNQRELAQVLSDLAASRAEIIAFYRSIGDEEWSRTGISPSSGEVSQVRLLVQASHHNVDHIEQITRVLAQR